MICDMIEKIKKILPTIIVILIIALVILNYPFFVSNKNGETTCHDLLGHTHNCHEQAYP